jgi:ubiquinone/menaquinone biosynthesis C-methylase UbiE
VAKEVCSKISSGRILDLGTGPGYLPIEIAKNAPSLEVFGIDLSSGMIDIANKNASDLGLSNRVKFQVANVSNLPFDDGFFDLIISTLSFHHWLDPLACFKEIHRVLKKNGEVHIYDLRRDTSKEVNGEVKKRYGWFLAFLFLAIVRAHSSITLKQAVEVLSTLKLDFSQKSVDEKGIILKLQLVK